MTPQPQVEVPATKLLPEKQIVDIIVYTAMLSSYTAIVDPLMDTLRNITSQAQGKEFSPADIVQLHALQQKLEYHLVHEERLRAFDYTSLHFHIVQRFTHGTRSVGLNVSIVVVIALAVVWGVVAATRLPVTLPPDLGPLLGMSVAYSVLYLATGALFLRAVTKLTAEARRAYLYICASVMGLAVLVWIQPAAGMLDLLQNPLAPALMAFPLVPNYILLYIGARKLGVLAGAKGRIISVGFLGVLAAGVIVLCAGLSAAVVPFTGTTLHLPYAMVAAMSNALGGLLLGTSAAILFRSSKGLTYLYTRATKALMYPLLAGVWLDLHFIAYWLTVGKIETNAFLQFGVLINTLAALLFLRAGYIFNKMHRY